MGISSKVFFGVIRRWKDKLFHFVFFFEKSSHVSSCSSSYINDNKLESKGSFYYYGTPGGIVGLLKQTHNVGRRLDESKTSFRFTLGFYSVRTLRVPIPPGILDN